MSETSSLLSKANTPIYTVDHFPHFFQVQLFVSICHIFKMNYYYLLTNMYKSPQYLKKQQQQDFTSTCLSL